MKNLTPREMMWLGKATPEWTWITPRCHADLVALGSLAEAQLVDVLEDDGAVAIRLTPPSTSWTESRPLRWSKGGYNHLAVVICIAEYLYRFTITPTDENRSPMHGSGRTQAEAQAIVERLVERCGGW